LLEARFPFGDVAKQGQLDSCACYKNRELSRRSTGPTSSSAKIPPAAGRYAHTSGHGVPGRRDCFERLFRADIAKRPPGNPQGSVLQTLVQRYPSLAADSRQRMIYLRNGLADYGGVTVT
jgi:hypothetical protein